MQIVKSPAAVVAQHLVCILNSLQQTLIDCNTVLVLLYTLTLE